MEVLKTSRLYQFVCNTCPEWSDSNRPVMIAFHIWWARVFIPGIGAKSSNPVFYTETNSIGPLLSHVRDVTSVAVLYPNEPWSIAQTFVAAVSGGSTVFTWQLPAFWTFWPSKLRWRYRNLLLSIYLHTQAPCLLLLLPLSGFVDLCRCLLYPSNFLYYTDTYTSNAQNS